MKNIKETLEVAQTFINRVGDLLKKSPDGNCYSNPKEQGAVRRSSMELTRALAEMRKP